VRHVQYDICERTKAVHHALSITVHKSDPRLRAGSSQCITWQPDSEEKVEWLMWQRGSVGWLGA
jgi:hypothetical protein